MDDGDGALTLELQAKKIADSIAQYNGSKSCTMCGGGVSPVTAMYSSLCTNCLNTRAATLAKGRMA